MKTMFSAHCDKKGSPRDLIAAWNPFTGRIETHERWEWDRIEHAWRWRNSTEE